MDSNGDFVVCRCENVTYAEMMKEMERGVNNAREMKLKTRAGMGFCNGRTCGHLVNKMMNETDSGPDFIHLRSQPPIRTISFETLAGGVHDD